jgi:hypothetical protein
LASALDQKKRKKGKEKLDMIRWIAAYEEMALAMHAAEVRVACVLSCLLFYLFLAGVGLCHCSRSLDELPAYR